MDHYQGLGGGSNGKVVFEEYKVSVGEEEKALEVEGGNCCTKRKMHLMP